MSSILRSLLIKVGVDLSEAQKGFKQAAKEFKDAGKELSSVGRNLTTGLTVPIVGAMAASVKFASDLEESTNKVNVAFNDSADTVKKWSDTTLKSYGIAKGTALDMAATFGDMGTAMGQLPETAADMSTKLAGLAGDLASFKNIGLEQASTALRGVYTGEGEALKSLGIIMQDSTLIAYAAANGYKKSYKEMDQAEKVALRYAYVMEATKNAQGDFARTGGGFANQFRMVQESLKEVAATLGKELLPMVTPVIKNINQLIGEFGDLDDKTKRTIITMAGVAAAIGPALTVFGKLSTSIGGVMSSLSAATKAIKGGAGFASALGTLIGPAGIAVLAVTAIAGIAVAASNLTKESRAATNEVKSFARSIQDSSKAFEANQQQTVAEIASITTLTNKLFALADKENKSNGEKLVMAQLVEQLNQSMPSLNLAIDEQTGKLNLQKTAVTELIAEKKRQLMLSAYESRLTEIYKEQASLTDEITAAQDRLNKAKQLVADTGNESYGMMRYGNEVKLAQEALDLLIESQKKTSSAAQSAETAYSNMAEAIANKSAGIVNESYNTGANAGNAFASGINSQMEAVGSAAARMATTLQGRLSLALDIHSPSRVTHKIGERASEGYIGGLLSGLDGIKNASGLMSGALTGLGSVPSSNVGLANAQMPISPNLPAQAKTGSDSPALIENNKLMRQLIGLVQSQDKAAVVLDGRQVGEATLPWTLKAAARSDQAWAVSAR